jgi:hypothetical protein
MKDYSKDNQQRLSLDDKDGPQSQDNRPECQTERVRNFDTTKETLDKRVSMSEIQTRESSPLREAASSRSESNTDRTESRGDQHGPKNSQHRPKNLVSAVRLLFPARQKLYSVDGFGRRSEIETGHMSEGAYQALLEACQNPIRFDGPPQDYDMTAAKETSFELPEGCKLGPETELPLPEWWELPGVEATAEEIQAMIWRNLKRAQREGKGTLSRVLAANLARIS